MLSFSISYPDLIKYPYCANLTQRGTVSEKRPKDRVKTGSFKGKLYCCSIQKKLMHETLT
jgi:hypothetical protein